MCEVFFFFNDTATTEIYTLSLHDALPISCPQALSVTSLFLFFYSIYISLAEIVTVFVCSLVYRKLHGSRKLVVFVHHGDRKSTRLNSSHANISYAVFCLKKNKLYALRLPT